MQAVLIPLLSTRPVCSPRKGSAGWLAACMAACMADSNALLALTTTNVNNLCQGIHYREIRHVNNGIGYIPIWCTYPVNTKHLYNICTTLDKRRRRWADVVQMLYKCFLFAGMCMQKFFCAPAAHIQQNWCLFISTLLLYCGYPPLIIF